MATKSFSRDSLYMKAIGYLLYIAAGFLLWQNMNFTLIAFQAAGVEKILAYCATGFIAVIESAVAIFLLSPSSWGEIARDISEEATGAVGSFSGTGRIAAASVAAFLVCVLVLLIGVTYYADWLSTIRGLGIANTSPEFAQYKSFLAILLVWGPEAATIVGHQVLRRAREASILQYEEDSRLIPALVLSRELKNQRVRQAKAQARTANWNPDAR